MRFQDFSDLGFQARRELTKSFSCNDLVAGGGLGKGEIFETWNRDERNQNRTSNGLSVREGRSHIVSFQGCHLSSWLPFEMFIQFCCFTQDIGPINILRHQKSEVWN